MLCNDFLVTQTLMEFSEKHSRPPTDASAIAANRQSGNHCVTCLLVSKQTITRAVLLGDLPSVTVVPSCAPSLSPAQKDPMIQSIIGPQNLSLGRDVEVLW